jgi:beta-lactam-binding protein with PASTA domain
MPTMPNVVGLDYPDALQAMVVAGVRVIPFGYFQVDPCTIAFTSAAARPGFVTAQTPAAGTPNVVANSPVALTAGIFPVSIAYPAGGSQT